MAAVLCFALLTGINVCSFLLLACVQAGISPIGWAVNKGHSSVVELFIQEELNGRLFYKVCWV